MTIIKISEFANYTREMILDFFEIHKQVSCEVTVPSVMEENDSFSIFVDYMRAAYVGELLEPICEDMMYTIPDLYTRKEFSYMLIGYSNEKLADILVLLLSAYDEDNFEAWSNFELNASTHFSEKPEHEDLACPEFIEIMNAHPDHLW